jgi:tRNA(Glu) U13 pseudouridine synthase TruD
MAEDILLTKKRKLEIGQLELNVMRLEIRSLEIEEEKVKIAENIVEQKRRIQELTAGK